MIEADRSDCAHVRLHDICCINGAAKTHLKYSQLTIGLLKVQEGNESGDFEEREGRLQRY